MSGADRVDIFTGSVYRLVDETRRIGERGGKKKEPDFGTKQVSLREQRAAMRHWSAQQLQAATLEQRADYLDFLSKQMGEEEGRRHFLRQVNGES